METAAPTAIDGHLVVSTHRPQEAPGLLARSFPDLRLEVPADSRPFLFRHSAFGDELLRSYEIVVSGPALAAGSLPADRVSVGHVVAGRFEGESGHRSIDPSVPFLRTAESSVLRMHDVHLRFVTFDASALRRVAGRAEAAGGPHLRLMRTRPTSASGAAAWRWVADRVHETVRDPRAVASPIVMEELFDLAARVLLRAFGDRAEVPDSPRSSAPAAVRRAVVYLEEHADGAVTMPEVAAAARVSVRSLQALFQRHLGVSPLSHLHAIRLEAARRELIDADRDEPGTVGEIAARWGFANSGRFARVYEARFGELPSRTMRRGR
ncbi:helix-turn-helix transcriptional regulator [uncultured Amnibacterium sp.]|uniref:helix-turn-helix transcriptional regulator n=1 Tax=uncultured Amnibacterium sp. TaxID=1631851 RepID=UPI0035CAB198